MATHSFSLLLCNLFIGLAKGARALGERGEKFRQLGYRVFRIEPVFLLGRGGRCNPDMVLSSAKTGHTLVVEWTNATSAHDDKKDQFHRYARVSKSDLVHQLAIPSKEAKTFDVVLVVSRIASGSFQKCLNEGRHPFILFAFAPTEEASELQKILGTIKETETEGFFSRSMSLRIPLRYVPFGLDTPSAKELVTHIVAHLVSLMVKGTKEFTIEEFCSGFASVWSIIGKEKRHEISQRTKEVLTRLTHKPIGVELLSRRQNINPPTWQLLKSPMSQGSARLLRSRLQEFISEVKGTSFQMDLPLDEVPSEEIRYDKR